MSPYTYVVLRYVHDHAAEESLNVGVLLSAGDRDFFDLRLDHRTGRLSRTFRGFSSDLHRLAMRTLAQKIRQIQERQAFGQGLLFPLGDAGEIAQLVLPELGRNYRFSETKTGEAENLEHALDELYARFVTTQVPVAKARRRRGDEDVWKEVAPHLPVTIAMRLRPASVEAGPLVFHFKHTYQNAQLHVVEPLSFDLVNPEKVRDKAVRWLGYADHLKTNLGTLNLVVEGPEEEAAVPAYHAALKMLRGVTNVYEVDQADKLSDRLAWLMR